MIQSILAVLLFTLGSSAQGSSETRFSCERRPSGYYADLETGCQVYHMCDGLGRQFSYSCPNATLFQQRMLICDHWYMVNCSKSEIDYTANLLIGQRDKPFLEDSEKHHRTPRPDLLTNLKTQKYNLIYRNGRSQFVSNFNLVGVETDNENSRSNTTDRPPYSLPSHWFTEYSITTTAQEPGEKLLIERQNKLTRNNDSSSKKTLVENYKTKIKSGVNYNRKFTNVEKKSDLDADLVTLKSYINTTPSFIPLHKQINIMSSKLTQHSSIQNQKSEPQKLGISYPLLNNMTSSAFYKSFYIQPYDLDTSIISSDINVNNDFKVKSIKKETLVQGINNNEMQLKNLRNFFLIPDYEFPLDLVTRPSYENGQSSFEVMSTLPDLFKEARH